MSIDCPVPGEGSQPKPNGCTALPSDLPFQLLIPRKRRARWHAMKTMNRMQPFLSSIAFLVFVGLPLAADEPVKEDSWLQTSDPATGVFTMTRELTLYPQAEPKPALKYRLLPDDFDLMEGNAALYYLKAMGFFEQSHAQQQLREMHKKWREAADAKHLIYNQFPPYSFLETAPKDLPLQEVKSYLELTRFQSFFLEEARRLRSFSLDRNIKHFDNPVGYLLPEVQSMRELARLQSMRCRVAIAEDRVDDAIQILGQQVALAKHMGNDDFYVSTLVGMAIHGIAFNDALYLLEHPKAPNLYWAFASLPSPLVELRRAHAFERQFLFEQVKVLREVNEELRPAGYWQVFLDRFLEQAKGLDQEGFQIGFAKDPEMQRASLVSMIAASYPGAKRYLIELDEIPSATIESYPTAQVVFLAIKKYYERTRDEYFKWNSLPLSIAAASIRKADAEAVQWSNRIGWCGTFTETLLPAMGAVRIAQARADQSIAMLQTIEAIRMYGATHHGKLPSSLSELSVPAPNDPFTGERLHYEVSGNSSILSGGIANRVRYRMILRFAPNDQR